MNSEPSEDQLDRIRAQIRADADAARARAPLPERAPTDAASDVQSAATPASIAELARHAGPAFVDHAYRAILGRAPDSAGFERQMAVLGSGAGKIEVIGDLRYSEEGRRRGVFVAGLRPRYLVAKLGNVPVIGALVQWLIALASLPHMLRHQRATEASLAVRFGETTAALHAAEHRNAELREATDALRSDLSSAVGELSDRLTQAEMHAHALRQYVESLSASVMDLRQLALTMNHWAVQVRKSIDAIDAAENERRAREDEVEAAVILRERSRDAERVQRLEAWTMELAAHMPPTAAVLDVCGGSDWLALLAMRGWSASSIEINSALHREARARSLNVTLGSPAVLLARVADQSLDALTIAALARISEEMKLAELVHEAQRVLKHGGVMLVDLGSDGSPTQAMMNLASGIGFTRPRTLDAFAGKALVLTRA